jgi:putative tricarboxylic transport membrane protein
VNQTRNTAELVTGLGIIALGVVLAVQASTIKVAPLYAKVGPAAFMWASSLLLIVCGSVVSWKAFSAPPDEGNEWSGPLTILAGLLASIFLMVPLGFVPAATFIFVLTARGLGSHQWLRDVLIGLVMTTVAFLIFSKGLGLRLPAGFLFS